MTAQNTMSAAEASKGVDDEIAQLSVRALQLRETYDEVMTRIKTLRAWKEGSQMGQRLAAESKAPTE